jgi:hypothetical protein
VDDWLKVLIAAAVGGVLALIAAVATGWFGYASKDEELRVHLVEIAIRILRADPAKEDVAPAREWAMELSTSTLACGLSRPKSGRRFAQAYRPRGFTFL